MWRPLLCASVIFANVLAAACASLPGVVAAQGAPATEPSSVNGAVSDLRQNDAGTNLVTTLPVSNKLKTSTWPRAGVADFVFRMRSHGGGTLARDIEEYDWRLEVESRRGLVSLEYFRSDADVPGTPIGLFREVLDDKQLAELDNLMASSGLWLLRPSMTRHPGPTQTDYTRDDPGKPRRAVTINDSDEETNAKIGSLQGRLDKLLATALARPERAVQAELTFAQADAGSSFVATIKNIGTERVVFVDPRSVKRTSLQHRAALLVTERAVTAPGEPPPALEWQEVPIVPNVLTPAVLVTLDPGQTWSASIPWRGTPGKRYLAYFSLANYDGEPVVAGSYNVRGRVDSNRVTVTP